MTTFTKVVLYTESDGSSRFKEEAVALPAGNPQSMLTPLCPSQGYQIRHSPLGYRSQVHSTASPRWAFVLAGKMEVGVPNGPSRIFEAGEHCYFADMLPGGVVFDPQKHGHWSQQLGDAPLVTLFIRD